jgi:hypothetical protein
LFDKFRFDNFIGDDIFCIKWANLKLSTVFLDGQVERWMKKQFEGLLTATKKFGSIKNKFFKLWNFFNGIKFKTSEKML